MATTTNFAVKDAIDMTITPIGGTGTAHTINYLNSCQLTLDSESVYAKKKGNDAIAFSSSRTGTFQMEAEVIDEQYLAWMLGGTLKEDGSIEVGGTAPSQAYKIEGTFAIQTEAGTSVTKKIVMYNCKPQISSDLTLSATEVCNFTLTFDVLVNDADKILDITTQS